MRVLNPGAQHIANNFSLFGFGSETTALVQCIKELLENSIDACKLIQYVDACPSIAITVSSVPEDSSVLLITLTDEGIGMNDSKRLLQCFTTTKVNNDDCNSVQTTGRFGVGLSTCLIYSLSYCNYPMRIISKVSCDNTCVVTDFTLDSLGNPLVSQSEQHIVDMISGTKISICVPISRDSDIKGAVQCVDNLLYKFSLLPTTFINTKFTVDIDVDLVDDMKHFESAYIGWSPSVAKLVLQTPTLTTYKDNLMKKVEVGDDSQSECSVSRVTIGSNDGNMVIASVIISKVDGIDKDNVNDCSSYIPVTVLRYANGVPLLDFQDDATSCAISVAMKAVRWSSFGCKLSLSLSSDGVSSQDICHPPAWVIQRLNQDNDSDFYCMTIICDCQSNSIPFANMRKTCIGIDKPLITALSTAIKKCLCELQEKDMTKRLFMSKRDSEQMKISTTYIPGVVSSVVKILADRKNEHLLREQLEKFDIQCDDVENIEILQNMLKDTLQSSLQELWSKSLNSINKKQKM